MLRLSFGICTEPPGSPHPLLQVLLPVRSSLSSKKAAPGRAADKKGAASLRSPGEATPNASRLATPQLHQKLDNHSRMEMPSAPTSLDATKEARNSRSFRRVFLRAFVEIFSKYWCIFFRDVSFAMPTERLSPRSSPLRFAFFFGDNAGGLRARSE